MSAQTQPHAHAHAHPVAAAQAIPAATTATPFTLTKDSPIGDYLAANRRATASLAQNHPAVLPISANGQSPHTLWIGCADSRVNECTALGCLPGEVFTLRNIANVVSANDASSASALQFAIEVLKVKKIIVCGHTDCGGVWASLSNKKAGGVLDEWLSQVRSVRAQHLDELAALPDINDKCKRLVELNVLNSVNTIRANPSYVEYSARGDVELYALVYDVATGLLREIPL